MPADLTADGSVDEVFDAIEQAWGPVEILVANAGAASSAPIVRITDGDWQRMLDLNLTAPFRCLRRALPAMTACWLGPDRRRGLRRRQTWRAVHRGVHRGQARRARPGPGGSRGGGENRRDRQCRLPRLRRHADDRRGVQAIVAATGRTPERGAGVLAAKQPIGRLVTVDEVADAVELCVTNAGRRRVRGSTWTAERCSRDDGHDLVNPDGLPQPSGFNHAVVSGGGRIVWLAGQTALDADGLVVAPGDVVAQFEQALRNLLIVLGAAGGTPSIW